MLSIRLLLLLLLLTLGDKVILGDESCKLTEVGKNKLFLKMACQKGITTEYKCPFSEEYYNIVYDGGCSQVKFNRACTLDHKFYQNCGHTHCDDWTTIGNHALFCSSFVCTDTDGSYGGTNNYFANMCGKIKCQNPDARVIGEYIDATNRCGGEGLFECTIFKHFVSVERTCDQKCDCFMCADEAECNNVKYGMFYLEEDKNRTRNRYIIPAQMCKLEYDAPKDEYLKEHEELCSEKHYVRNCTNPSGESVALHTRQICSTLEDDEDAYVCNNLLDQINCTDMEKVGLWCMREGFNTSVSKQAICRGRSLCDDGYDDNCVEPEGGCLIHKNQLCDGISDCPGGRDETTCSNDKTDVMCIRSVNMKGKLIEKPILKSWIMDGHPDCRDGKDEDESYWTKCDSGRVRYQIRGTKCDIVFKCLLSGFANLSELCDRVDSCPGENNICEVARNQPDVPTIVPENRGKVKIAFGYLLPGLPDFNKTFTDVSLATRPENLFGVQNLTVRGLVRPCDCDHVYGEQYVLLSCLGMCTKAICPLPEVRHDACINIPLKHRIYTYSLQVNNPNLTVVRRRKQQYFGDIFSCDNRRCIGYEKVCNLIDDCGDGSDEKNCDNNFSCSGADKSQSERIPISSKCDGFINCKDFEDECNADCKNKELLKTVTMKALCWIMGSLAVSLNMISLYASLRDLCEAKTFTSAMNRSLILLIAISDLMMGIYLIAIAIFDRKYGDTYCRKKFLWFVSVKCAALGILSTVASQMSLITMTTLSAFRLITIRRIFMSRSLCIVSIAKVATTTLIIFLASVIVASAPLLQSYEDYFVNGLYYHHNPLFTASVSKSKHLQIISSYFGGRIRDSARRVLSWHRIDIIVRQMFTVGWDGQFVLGSRVHFYGNDGVCVFKYLVGPEDSQRAYTITVLALNVMCFVVMAVAYTAINIKTGRSSHRATGDTQQPQNLRRRKLQAKVSAIILSDFLCWIPFTTVCILHYAEVMNAQEWYPIFSIVLLPINSIINPLLYVNKFNEVASSIRNQVTTASQRTFAAFSGGGRNLTRTTHQLPTENFLSVDNHSPNSPIDSTTF